MESAEDIGAAEPRGDRKPTGPRGDTRPTGPRSDTRPTASLRRPRAPVMSDVGRLAGVSHQTVSRVINGSPHVRPETREKVQAAMQELGYRPNPVARALVTGRSKTLGVVNFDTTLFGPGAA